MNLLFVDNPVGSGFSYVDDESSLTTTNEEIGADLVHLMRDFLKNYPKFQTVPFYIFSESYGGKMAVEFALQLEKVRQHTCKGKTNASSNSRRKKWNDFFIYQEQKAGKVNVNFKGVGLGGPWISPIDSVMTWAPYLYNVVRFSIFMEHFWHCLGLQNSVPQKTAK